ncbi:MAG: acetolactate synthase small subunit, partial [Acidobacteriota bacterium]
VRVNEENRAEILALSEVFRARVIDVSPRGYIFEVTGQSEKIDAFLQNMRVYGIREIHRTGELALSRGRAEKKNKSSAVIQPPPLVDSKTKQMTSRSEVKANHG